MVRCAALVALAVLALGAEAFYSPVKKHNGRQIDCGTVAECEEHARAWLDNDYEVEQRILLQEYVQKDWEYNTNINDENANAALIAAELVAAYDKQVWTDHVTQYDYESFTDPLVKRRLEKLSVLGNAALPEASLQAYNRLISDMTSIYGAAKVCPFDNQECDVATEGLTLEPDLEAILADTPNRSWDELVYVWQQWRDASGKLMRQQFIEYLALSNEAAVANGFNDNGEMWLDAFTSDLPDDYDFRADLEELWAQTKPLYEKVHAYLRYRYREHWGEELMPNANDPIPAHLSGNMWAQAWQNTYDLVAPFPDVDNPLGGIDQAMREQNYTAERIFELSNSFFTQLGLDDMTMCFDTPCGQSNSADNVQCHYDNPMIVKPDWDVVCHASAWDMYHETRDDFRIKQCTDIDLESLITVHHEMGHIEYFIQYVNQPLQFRDGANEGFHEAIGDVMALAVQTPVHLNSIGLLPEIPDTPEADINYLLTSAMERLMFLPFAYTIDQYRWALFNGTLSTDTLTYSWWQLRERYQGIVPPVMRSEEDFDAGAKYHVPASVPYIRYYVAHILQYQFYKQMCLDSEQYDPEDPDMPLYKCDFSAGPLSGVAGERMKEMLMKGSSEPWPDVLEAMTGSRKADPSAILEYFLPLSDWLDEQIAANDIPVGWTSTFEQWIE